MAMRAMAYDYVAVPLMGVSSSSVVVLTFALGLAMAAAAGILDIEPYLSGVPQETLRRCWLAEAEARRSK